MTEPTSRHDELVGHLRRHTELRRQAATAAVDQAVNEDPEEAAGDEPTSGG